VAKSNQEGLCNFFVDLYNFFILLGYSQLCNVKTRSQGKLCYVKEIHDRLIKTAKKFYVENFLKKHPTTSLCTHCAKLFKSDLNRNLLLSNSHSFVHLRFVNRRFQSNIFRTSNLISKCILIRAYSSFPQSKNLGIQPFKYTVTDYLRAHTGWRALRYTTRYEHCEHFLKMYSYKIRNSALSEIRNLNLEQVQFIKVTSFFVFSYQKSMLACRYQMPITFYKFTRIQADSV